jgi:hypothetical protein
MSYVESDRPNGKTGNKTFHGLESLREDLRLVTSPVPEQLELPLPLPPPAPRQRRRDAGA